MTYWNISKLTSREGICKVHKMEIFVNVTYFYLNPEYSFKLEERKWNKNYQGTMKSN
jgi:hypothetical protein